nr:hypothetical protein [Tanacetum cinerariifolium]
MHQEKIQKKKLKAVKARLNFEEVSQHSESGTPSRRRDLRKRLGSKYICNVSGSPKPRHDRSESPRKRGPKRKTVFKRLEKGVFHRLGDKEKEKMQQRSGRNLQHQAERWGIHERVCAKVQARMQGCEGSSKMHENLRIYARNYNPKLIKQLHDKIPKSVDEMMRVTITFLRGEVVASNRKRKKSFPSWKQQEAGQKKKFKNGGFRNQQRSERKQDRQRQQKRGNLKKRQAAGNPDGTAMAEGSQTKDYPNFLFEVSDLIPTPRDEDGMEGLMIIEAEMEGYFVHRMYEDGGPSLKILYEHCFNRFHSEVIFQMVPAATPLVEFSGEIIWPLWSPSSYNRIIGRPGVKRIHAVPSTAHGMLKFPVTGGTVTLRSSRIIPLECTMVSGPGTQQPIIDQVTKEKIQVAIHPKYPKQTIAIGSTLTEKGRKELCGLLRHNIDIFA